MPPSLIDQLCADVYVLRKEAGHVDVEDDAYDGTRAGDWYRHVADRIESLQARHAALLAALAALVETWDQRGNNHESVNFPMSSQAISECRCELAAIVKAHRLD